MSASFKASRAATEALECRARCMRLNPTSSEYVLWQALRGGRLGVAFRRQVPIGRYIVDFLASSERFIVEVDGGYHAERRTADCRRRRWPERQGYRVVRGSAALVLRDAAAAVCIIGAAL